MSIVSLIVVLIVIGVVLYLVPLDEPIKKGIYVLLLLMVALWIMSAFGLLDGGPIVRIN